MESSFHPFWPSKADVDAALKKVGACDHPDHWVKADVVHTVDVPRDDGTGVVERRYQCPTCGRVYVLDAVI